MLNTLPMERYVLACCLNDVRAVWETAAIIEPKDFNYIANGYVFAQCKDLAEHEQAIDIISIYNRFSPEVKKIVDAADSSNNGLHYLEVLKKSPYSFQNLLENIRIIKSVATRKKIAENLTELVQKLEKDSDVLHTNELVEGALNKIVDVAFHEHELYTTGHIGEGLREYVKTRAENPEEVPGFKTGFLRFDMTVGGLMRGKLYIVVARPKIGKSTMLLNWAKALTVDQRLPSLYLDTEMTTEEQQTRLLAMISGVEEKKIITGLFSRNKAECDAIDEAIAVLENSPFYHLYIPDFNIDKIIALTRKYKVQHGIQAMFFDYIKIPEMDDLRLAQEWQLLGYLTTGLKNQIAGKLDIPVVTAGQLNKKNVGSATIETDQIGGSDRLLHYTNFLLGLRPKTQKELEQEQGRKGRHVLNIVASRNTEDDIAFDIKFDKSILRMREVGVHSESGAGYYGVD